MLHLLAMAEQQADPKRARDLAILWLLYGRALRRGRQHSSTRGHRYRRRAHPDSRQASDRPELLKALALARRRARRRKATLLVAKLDRLARNTHVITSLPQSGVSFRAADMPAANEFMVQILAAVAEYEARLISERTKAGLASARARGVKLGEIESLAQGKPCCCTFTRSSGTSRRSVDAAHHRSPEGEGVVSAIDWLVS